MAPQHRGQIDLGARAFHQANQNQSPAVCERLEVRTQIGRADTVQDDVGAASVGGGLDRRRERAGLVVDRDVSAELEALLALGVVAGGHDRAHARFLA